MMFEADDKYGTGFYNNKDWVFHYQALKELTEKLPAEITAIRLTRPAFWAGSKAGYTNPIWGGKMDAQSIIDAVNAIEVDIYESSKAEYFNITFITNGYIHIVEFCGIQLWDSDSDDRQYTDESDESTREPIETHLRKRLREEISKLNTITV